MSGWLIYPAVRNLDGAIGAMKILQKGTKTDWLRVWIGRDPTE